MKNGQSYFYPFALLLQVLCVLLGFTSCSPKEPKYRIGVSQCSSGTWRETLNKEMERELLFMDDVTMEIRTAEDNRDKQIQDIQYFIDQKVDLLVVAPLESDAIDPIITKAYRSGIPVVLFDRKIASDDYTAFVGGDNFEIGQRLAEYIISKLPNGGQVLELTGHMESSPAILRHQGLLNGLKNNADIELLASVDVQWMAPKAVEMADSLLGIYPSTDIIVAHSDWIASEVKSHIDSIMPSNHVRCIGVDGSYAPGLLSIQDGKEDASVIYPTAGDVVIRTALQILKGEPYQRENYQSSYIIQTKEDAALTADLLQGIDREVEKIQQLKELVDYYWRQNNLERALLYVLLAFLVVTIAFFIQLYRSYQIKRQLIQQLRSQQDTLVQQRDDLLSLTQELEQATMSKLMFFTNISHDFRTPLSLISAPIERVIQKSNLPAEDSRLLQLAYRNVSVLLRLVNQILDFQKTENNKMELHLRAVDVAQTLQEWTESFQSLAVKKRITLEFQKQPGNYQSMVDVNKLERILYNLLGNALKFTPKDGTISVQLAQQGPTCIIKVCDNGIGIDVKHIHKIFDNYYQVNDSSNQIGTGLGLALVKSFVELHGGTISADNLHQGTGSVFTVQLPIRSVEGEHLETKVEGRLNPSAEVQYTMEEDEPVSEGITTDQSKPLVLVIDDNTDIRAFFNMLLRDKYRVVSAKNGMEGWEKAQQLIPDLIVSDVMMPVMDGLEFCRKLKNDVLTSHIPVVMLTACSMDEQRVQGLEEGADAYLSKPFNSSVLLAQLESLVNNRKHILRFYASKKSDSSKVIMSAASVRETGLVEPPKNKYDAEFLEKLMQCIQAHLADEGYSIELLASDCCLSRSQLFRKCKALTGESPVELLRNKRLQQAKQLFMQGHASVAQVAEMVGFSDPSYFSKCYKTLFGVLPKQDFQ